MILIAGLQDASLKFPVHGAAMILFMIEYYEYCIKCSFKMYRNGGVFYLHNVVLTYIVRYCYLLKQLTRKVNSSRHLLWSKYFRIIHSNQLCIHKKVNLYIFTKIPHQSHVFHFPSQHIKKPHMFSLPIKKHRPWKPNLSEGILLSGGTYQYCFVETDDLMHKNLIGDLYLL